MQKPAKKRILLDFAYKNVLLSHKGLDLHVMKLYYHIFRHFTSFFAIFAKKNPSYKNVNFFVSCPKAAVGLLTATDGKQFGKPSHIFVLAGGDTAMMSTWSIGQWLLYGGIAAMGAAVVCSIVVCAVFTASGQWLRRVLEEEYGELYSDRQKPRR